MRLLTNMNNNYIFSKNYNPLFSNVKYNTANIALKICNYDWHKCTESEYGMTGPTVDFSVFSPPPGGDQALRRSRT